MTQRHARASLVSWLLAPAALGWAACTSNAGSSPSGGGAAPNAEPPLDPASTLTNGEPLDVSGLAQWCPECAAAEGGDTTDFGGQEYIPEGCSSSEAFSELTVSEALARKIDLSSLPVGLDEQFEAQVRWREQDRSSRLTVTARLDPGLLVWEHLPLDGGSGQRCPVHLMGSVHVTLATDDGSISGSFDANPTYWLSPPKHARKLALMVEWGPAVQLQGNLQLNPQPTAGPRRLTLQFVWYRIDAIAADRVGVGITVHEAQSEGTPCVGLCRLTHALATAVPLDDCLPWELPLNGACVALAEHPVYGASASPPDAGAL
ncbi:MAG TPA: hypothetical protein VJU61_16435 [Polyangiaceae bacterium]|nr:hypothetical protein [Polyangiaceae bacterium]